MYEILYTKQAVKDIEKLKKSKSLYQKYLARERLIAKDSFCPAVPEGDFSQMKGTGYHDLYQKSGNKSKTFNKFK